MKLAAYAALLALSLVAPFLFYPVFLMQALCMAIFASAFNLLFGYVGLLSFGHAAFFGSAAYIAGYAVKDLGLSPELAITAGAGVGAALGFLIGGLAVRRQGIYFAMITFALAEIVYFVCIQTSFTGGENGLQSVPRGRLFSIIDLENDFVMYYFVLCIFLGSTALYLPYCPFSLWSRNSRYSGKRNSGGIVGLPRGVVQNRRFCTLRGVGWRRRSNKDHRYAFCITDRCALAYVR